MTHISNSPPRASSRYPAAALVASVTLALLELAPPWAAGPGRAELHNAVGQLARYLASLFTPAPSLVRAGSDRARMAYELFLCGEALLMAAFICLLWWRIRPAIRAATWLDTRLLSIPLLTVQLLIGVALDSLAFHLIFAMQLAALLPLRRALAWLALQLLLGIAMDAWVLARAGIYLSDNGIGTTLAILTSERCVLLLGFALAYMVLQEQQGRMRLAASNAQLRATQSLLGDTVRASERMRIARDLNDAVGHHLTALNLHLDLALRQSASQLAGQPATALATARELSLSLLAEVRGVVSTERQESGIKVRQALQLLCAGIPSPAIELAMDSRVDECPPAAAHTLLCCVQEAVTNTVRHARATLLTIDIQADSHGLLARIADNGQGSGGAPEGNGLAGMRERLSEHGGMLCTGRSDGNAGAVRHGYCLEFSLPLAGARA
ncbi:hypothetical protein ASD15_08085 [Massilia sp. Root351]|uniref:sensor histidine kinase n=1 Tax=Massilia sp. Root351 TaxID=1736522 RepID=UPI00070A1279|nr:histidine kinase [Massilia sp. Root351]KQV85073.1 hypothetical protein ASD15_08085 [Massilia sp. Root351]